MRVSVILPAAGLGTRMSAGGANPGAPKQFLELRGIPILVHTLRVFMSLPAIEAIYIAVRKSEIPRLESLLKDYGIGEKAHIVGGGDTRQASVANALAAVLMAEGGADDDIVLVHDAVRPLIDAAVIARTIEAVEAHGAAIVALPAVDTIKQVERTAHGAIIMSTIPREYVAVVPGTIENFKITQQGDLDLAEFFLGQREKVRG
jgi:2-C-methyl-D-erythritol 4-phosphate cytidylyltransferase